MDDRFSRWLDEAHYGKSTARKALRDLQRAEQGLALRGVLPDDSNVRAALRRYLTFSQEAGAADQLTDAAEAEGLTPLARKPGDPKPRRKLEARSFAEDDWDALTRHVSDSADPRDQVLWAMGLTGLRVGDVLRVDEISLRKGLRSGELQLVRKGGNVTPLSLAIPEPWIALHKGMRHTEAFNVAEYVSPEHDNPEADGAAHKRVYRRLGSLGKKLGLEGRFNTHRLRRTFAVHALEHTDNTVDVQQALGHKNINSTMRYIDEVNVRRMGELQRALHGKRSKRED